MLRLAKKENSSIPVKEMKDGDIAVITNWGVNNYVGRIVQRYKNYLLTLGAGSGFGWGEYFINNKNSHSNRVRLLEVGEVLVVGEF